MSNLDRRQWLQGAGAAGVVAFSDRDRERLADLDFAAPPPPNLAWNKAPCRFCGTGCGVEVGVQDGKVMAVRGDTKSPVNQGLLCVKGYHLPGFLYGEDRLKYPMRRGADGKLTRIAWDDALDLIASKFKDALATGGPDAVAMYGSGQWTMFDGYAALKWVKGGMQSNNLDPNARACAWRAR